MVGVLGAENRRGWILLAIILWVLGCEGLTVKAVAGGGVWPAWTGLARCDTTTSGES